ncbi:MAG: leucine-rich repeat protein [Candidatus Heimdallarchaeota archaeon]|nr:leucine-rich repeat protein [Candidatus Heimdallarchaeota archaeon]
MDDHQRLRQLCEKLEIDYDGVVNSWGTYFEGNNLVGISISKTELESLPDDIFDGFASLRDIDLSANKLTSLPESIFSSNPELTDIDLSNNKLIELHSKQFIHQTHLLTLALDGNRLQNLPKEVFKSCTQLQALFLYDNELEQLDEEIFNQMQSLEVLSIYNNKLSKLPRIPDTIEVLFVAGNQLIMVEDEFSHLKKIQNIAIETTKEIIPELSYNELDNFYLKTASLHLMLLSDETMGMGISDEIYQELEEAGHIYTEFEQIRTQLQK